MEVMLPPTLPKQRLHLWTDVVELVTPGFLSHTVTIAGTIFGIRSPYPQDAPLALARTGPKGTTANWQAWVLAGATWIAGGQVLLAGHNAAVPLYRMYHSLPSSQLNRLFGIVLGLWRRYGTAVGRSMLYCYEDTSRTLWQGYGSKAPTQWPAYQGLAAYGLNHVQQTWVAYNQYKDSEEKQEWDWQCAKLVASAMSKGIEKLNKQDKQRRQEGEEARQRDLDTMYYQLSGLLEDGADVGRGEGQVKTVDDLEGEMRRWVAGERDWHDDVVANYKAELSARKQRGEEERDARLAQLNAIQHLPNQQAAQYQDIQSPQLVGYTAAQVAAIMPKGRLANVTTVVEGTPAERLYNKHVVGQQIPANLDAGPLPPDLDEAGPTLNDRLDGRQVRVGVADG